MVVSTSSFLFDMPIGPETRKNNGEMDLMGCFFLDSFYPKTIGKTERWNAEISQQFSASAQPLGEKKIASDGRISYFVLRYKKVIPWGRLFPLLPGTMSFSTYPHLKKESFPK